MNGNSSGPYDGVVRGLVREAPTHAVVLEVLVLLLLLLVSLLGNVLVCIVVHRSRRIQSTTNYFVVSLAFSDLCVSVLCVPFVLARLIAGSWVGGQFFCKLVRFAQHAGPAATIFVLVSICVDRYYTIIYPLSFKVTRGTAKRMILCSWAAAALLSCLCFYFFVVQSVRVPLSSSASSTGGGGSGSSSSSTSSSSSSSSSSSQSHPDSSAASAANQVLVCPTVVPATSWGGLAYVLVMALCHFLLPVLIMGGLYTQVVRYIWTAGTPGVRAIQRTGNPVPRAKVKMVKMLLVVTGATLALLTPLYVTQLAYCFEPWRFVDRRAFVFSFWCVVATGSLKPLLYLCYNTNFRRGCKEVFCMSAMRCYRSHTYAITTASMFGKKNHVGVMEITSPSQGLLYDSPTKAFNRSLHVEKSAWPLSGSLPSTYV